MHCTGKDVSRDRRKVPRGWDGGHFWREASPGAGSHADCLRNGDWSRDQIKRRRYEEWQRNQKGSLGSSGNAILGNLNLTYRWWGAMEGFRAGSAVFRSRLFEKSLVRLNLSIQPRVNTSGNEAKMICSK